MRWITVGPADQPGTSIVLQPPVADPGVTDAERRTIAEMMAKGTYASIILATPDLDATFERLAGRRRRGRPGADRPAVRRPRLRRPRSRGQHAPHPGAALSCTASLPRIASPRAAAVTGPTSMAAPRRSDANQTYARKRPIQQATPDGHRDGGPARDRETR